MADFLVGTSDDMEAIDRYITSVSIVNKAAIPLQDEWKSWYNQLGWYDKNLSQDVYNQARNRRNAFNLANTVNEADKTRVEKVIASSFTEEEAAGKSRIADSKGNFFIAPKPIIPDWVKYGAMGIGALTVILSAVTFAGVKAYKP